MTKITRGDIVRLYQSPGHPAAFSSPATIFNHFHGKVPLSFIKSALEEVESYTLHREYKRPRKHNPFYSHHRRKDFQADLIVIEELASANDNVKYLLVIIDVFTRKLWVVPLHRKSAQVMKGAIKCWLDSLEEDFSPSMRFFSDKGLEFKCRAVQELLSARGIHQYFSQNVTKAAVVERANRTLQVLIYKYLTESGQNRYVEQLPGLVRTYNSRPHRTLNKMTPNEADKAWNEDKVRDIHIERCGKLLKASRKPLFAVGDTVRIKILAKRPARASRAYAQQFHPEIFEVVSITKNLPVLMYVIKSTETDEVIRGGFYANELTRVRS